MTQSPQDQLTEDSISGDPMEQFRLWFDTAERLVEKHPNAMTLATIDENGWPAARIVLLKGFDQAGFKFFTNYESNKGKELEHNPRAALVFYWSLLDRQVRITGAVTKVSKQESQEYFQTRPRESQIGAWVSEQSAVIQGRKPLEERFTRLTEEYQDKEIPLPPHWGGYLLTPDTVEFWLSRPARLHDRIRYCRSGSGWLIERLSP
ncbi:MAG TPA: pyridoxamine 5'-phosphate oxidase [Blastocatellia bacterium]|nr:pyridoxamine 5'-phosphate oxidase [Blastocatellia bacterium]